MAQDELEAHEKEDSVAANVVEQSSQLMGLNWLRLKHKWERARERSAKGNQQKARPKKQKKRISKREKAIAYNSQSSGTERIFYLEI